MPRQLENLSNNAKPYNVNGGHKYELDYNTGSHAQLVKAKKEENPTTT